MPGILTVAVFRDEKVSKASKEALGMARGIAKQTGDQVATALVGREVSSFAQELIVSGADVVYLSDDVSFTEFDADVFLEAVRRIAEEVKPRMMILPGDAVILEMAPRLAFRLGAGLVTDCIDFEVQGDRFVFIKPVYGGKALAKISVASPLAVITVRPRSQAALPQDSKRGGKVLKVEAPIKQGQCDFILIERIREKTDEINLEDARIVVSGGRGIGGVEGFGQLKNLAKILDGAVGASRAAVDAGWISPSCQIGQTGKIVAPEIYFAIALSGSSQHLAGMNGSKVIVAINRDAEAPIFRVADIGVVDDYRNVLPALVNELNRALAKS